MPDITLVESAGVTLVEIPGLQGPPGPAGSGSTLPLTSLLLKGDGTGNAVAAVAGTDFLAPTGSGALLTGVLKPANNLSDIATPATARTNLGATAGVWPGTLLQTQFSLTSDASGLKLSGDASAPGNSKYYGTDSGGTKGFFDLPTSAGTLPSQTGNNGKYLTTNGTTASWATVAGGGDALVAQPLSQFAATTSSQLRGVLSDETGSGSAVFATSPTLVTPALGAATATSINKVAITAPASSATLTIANGKTLTASNTLTFTGTDGSTLAIGAGGTLGSAAFTASSAYQVANAGLTSLAAASGTNTLYYRSAANTWTPVTISTGLTFSAGVLTSASGGGDCSTVGSVSVDSEVALYSGIGGKTLKRATGTGLAKLTSGVLSTASSVTDYVAPTSYSAKGALLGGTGTSTFATLTVGSNGKFLSADSTQTTGLRWVTPTITSVNDPIDATKQMVIDVSGFPTATTRTFTPPNADFTGIVPSAATNGQFATGVLTSGAVVYGNALARTVTNKTANYTVLVGDTGTVITNAGASGTVNCTLPVGSAGLVYKFHVTTANSLTITAPTGATIRIGASVTATSGNITSNTIGNFITLLQISTTKFVSESHEGTWTVN